MSAEDDFTGVPPPVVFEQISETVDNLFPPSLKSYEVPADGKVYSMYHGTSRDAADEIWQSPDGMLGRGVYLSRYPQEASRYPLHLPENQRVVLRVRVKVGRVKKIDHQNHPMRRTWHDHRYDTAWCPSGALESGLEEYCVWDPNRISIISERPPGCQVL